MNPVEYRGTDSWFRFKRGDYIRVTLENGTVLYGTALEDKGSTGYADFDMMLPPSHSSVQEQILSFNLNHVKVELMFIAKVAREEPSA